MPYLVMVIMALLAGCSEANEASGGDAGVPCGPNVCEEGLVCCNESCGICTPPDGTCVPVECEDPGAPLCEPMDAAGTGGCGMLLGYAFDGEECVSLSGCSCEGADCDSLFGNLAECERACVESEGGESCGGITGATCSAGFFCDYDEEDGVACMGGGVCTRFEPTECVSPGVSVCGCDYETYASRCAAHAAGVDVLHDGACEI